MKLTVRTPSDYEITLELGRQETVEAVEKAVKIIGPLFSDALADIAEAVIESQKEKPIPAK